MTVIMLYPNKRVNFSPVAGEPNTKFPGHNPCVFNYGYNTALTTDHYLLLINLDNFQLCSFPWWYHNVITRKLNSSCPINVHSCQISVYLSIIASDSKVTVGLANSGLRDDVHLGCQNNSIGYHSDTGVVVSNHCSRSQTKPPKYGVGKCPQTVILTTCTSFFIVPHARRYLYVFSLSVFV